MKTLFVLLLAAATGGYASAQTTDYSGKKNQSTGSVADTSVSKFIIKAMKSSAMEIEAGQLAQQRTQNADVKAYATQMVTDHTKAINELRPIALKRDIDVSTVMSQNSAGSTNASGSDLQSETSTTSGSAVNTSSGNNQARSSTGTATTRTSVNYDTNTRAGVPAMADTSRHAMHHDKLTLLKQKSGVEFDQEYMTMMVKDHTKAVRMFEKASTFNDTEIKAFATKTLPVLREHLSSAETIVSSLQSTNTSGNE